MEHKIIGRSLHIEWSELACKDGTPYPVEFVADGRLIELIVMFERIRQIWGRPIVINSAYRTVNWNKQVGGSPHSQHLLGKALDLQPPKDVTVEEFHSMLLIRHEELGIRGLGKYSAFCHCDIRDSKTLVEWAG